MTIERADTAADAAGCSAPARCRSTGKVLAVRLVDDSQVFLDATSDVLSQFSGCQVVGFTRSGVEALVRALAPDVVVTDLFMPGNERAGTDAEAFPPDVTPAAACPTTIPARR